MPQEVILGDRFHVESDIEEEEEGQQKVIQQLKVISEAPELQFLKGTSPYFSSFAKATILNLNNSVEAEEMDIPNALERAYTIAIDEGLPQLQEEAQKHISLIDPRNGRMSDNLSSEEHVTFSLSKRTGDCWRTNATIVHGGWEILDYGDNLPWSEVSKELIDDLGSTDCEKNQCLVIHMAAGLYYDKKRSSQGNYGNGEFPGVSKLASSIRSDMYAQAKECHDSIGELSSETSLLKAEMKSHAHDMCKRNHDKDNRIILCFPPRALENHNICIINVSPSLRFTVHIYSWETGNIDNWIFLIAYRSHMRLAISPSCEAKKRPTLKAHINVIFQGVGESSD